MDLSEFENVTPLEWKKKQLESKLANNLGLKDSLAINISHDGNEKIKLIRKRIIYTILTLVFVAFVFLMFTKFVGDKNLETEALGNDRRVYYSIFLLPIAVSLLRSAFAYKKYNTLSKDVRMNKMELKVIDAVTMKIQGELIELEKLNDDSPEVADIALEMQHAREMAERHNF